MFIYFKKYSCCIYIYIYTHSLTAPGSICLSVCLSIYLSIYLFIYITLGNKDRRNLHYLCFWAFFFLTYANTSTWLILTFCLSVCGLTHSSPFSKTLSKVSFFDNEGKMCHSFLSAVTADTSVNIPMSTDIHLSSSYILISWCRGQ